MKLKVFGVFSVLLAVSKCIKCDSINESPSWLNCTDLNPQKDLEKYQVRERNILVIINCKNLIFKAL